MMDKTLTIRRKDGAETFMYVMDCIAGVGTKIWNDACGECEIVAEREMSVNEREMYNEVVQENAVRN